MAWVAKAYNGGGDLENLFKELKSTLQWDKSTCLRFAIDQIRLLMRVLAYNLLFKLLQFYLVSEEFNGKWDCRPNL
jgi:hypothetical protein